MMHNIRNKVYRINNDELMSVGLVLNRHRSLPTAIGWMYTKPNAATALRITDDWPIARSRKTCRPLGIEGTSDAEEETQCTTSW